MRAQGIMRHELFRDDAGRLMVESALHVNGGQFTMFAMEIGIEFCEFLLQRSLFAVCL